MLKTSTLGDVQGLSEHLHVLKCFLGLEMSLIAVQKVFLLAVKNVVRFSMEMTEEKGGLPPLLRLL